MNVKRIKTIIVDDEARIRRGIERLVKSCGEEWDVIATFADGQELLDAYELKQFDFDVLITDVRMPLVDGLSLIKEMKNRTTFNPIVISGFDDFSYLQTALREGALDYLIKPIDREEFKSQLASIKEKINKQWQEQAALKRIEEQAIKLRQNEKLSEITKGYELDVSNTEWKHLFPEGIYSLLYISIDQAFRYSKLFSKDEWLTWNFAYENILEEMLAYRKLHSWKWKGEDASIWLLLNSQEGCEESFKDEVVKFAYTLQKNVREYTPLTSSIAISQIFFELPLVQTISKDLLVLIQHRLIFGANTIFHPDMPERNFLKKTNTQLAEELPKIIQKLIRAFEQKTESELRYQLNKFVNELKGIRKLSEIEFFVQSLNIQLINFLLKRTPRSLNDTFLNIEETAKIVKKIGDFTELQQEIKQWVMMIFDKYKTVNEEIGLNQVELAKEWIVSNLSEHITIEKISNHVYMNPTYFCECFKNQTGETVLDFVTSTRINKARELLLTTNLKVYQICEQVGYSDTKYFSKLFKKHYGELPSKYKETIKKQMT
ncbi:response regulator transcription factor [Halalkalibacter urbisdiaboli]|uniref:response regulator transcription factor n=1 Tax=Halalkalibacter urbisdiaboli TaxID=1960589 RepID=UPI0013FE059B|nr:response regulator [Halalkalibacter urbisdiaboli]